MVRDEGWQFLLLGRSLEQMDMTSRLVASASLKRRQPMAVGVAGLRRLMPSCGRTADRTPIPTPPGS